MARFTGFRCDRDGCTTAAEGSGKNGDGTPDGWITVTIAVADYAPGVLTMCGTRCVGTWAKERLAAERDQAGRVKRATGPGRVQHDRDHHSEPDLSCPFCIAAMTPGATP